MSQILSPLYGHTTFPSSQIRTFNTISSELWLPLYHVSNFCIHSAPTFNIQRQCKPQPPLSLSPHILHIPLIFSLSMTFLMLFVLKACSHATIISPSVSFFKLLRLNHAQDSEPLKSSVATKYRSWSALFL